MKESTSEVVTKIRLGQPADLAKLEALRLKREYFPSLLRDSESYYSFALACLNEYFAHREQLADWQLLVLTEDGEPQGYLLFAVDQEHGVTRQLQADMLDFAVFNFAHLEALLKRARKVVAAFENEYLAVELAALDKRRQVWFYRCGFRAEQQRSAWRFPQGYQGISSPAFRVRTANPGDLPFILEVHAANATAYLPGGRDVDLETMELSYQLTYLMLDLEGGDDGCHYLLMEEVSSGIPAGYIFLRPGGISLTEPTLYVYDVAIAPKFAGRGLSLYLAGAAQTQVGKHGGLLYGDASLGVPALASWHTQLGGTVDSYLYALDCRQQDEASDVKGM